jgi:hypothetical protein
MNGITKFLKPVGGFIVKETPSILTGLSVVGVFGTIWFTADAVPKALAIIDQERYERKQSEDLTFKEKFTLTWRVFVPTAISAAITVGSIVTANSVNLKRNSALAALYSISEIGLKEYKDKVVEVLGKNKEQGIRDDIDKDHVAKNPINSREMILTGKGETICYDTMSGRYFKSDINAIRKVINDINEDLLKEGFVSLNDLYYELGLADIKIGNHSGWSIEDGQVVVSYSSQLTETGVPCLVMDYTVEPKFKR